MGTSGIMSKKNVEGPLKNSGEIKVKAKSKLAKSVKSKLAKSANLVAKDVEESKPVTNEHSKVEKSLMKITKLKKLVNSGESKTKKVVKQKKAGQVSEPRETLGTAKVENDQIMNNKNDKSAVRVLKRKHDKISSTGSSKSIGKKKNSNEEKVRPEPELVKKQKKQKVQSKKVVTEQEGLNLKDLSKEHILQCITAIFHLTEEQLKNKNALFDGESHPIFMQVTCIRVPKTPRRQMRMLLPHSLVSPNDEIALIVCDQERGRRKDYEPTVEHYEELLKSQNCTSIKTVIPLNQLKTEYDQHELKRTLVSSYDWFLVDGRIAGHVSHILGKHFYKKRKVPIPIKMQSKDLKHEIEYALKKTSMELHSFGDCHIVQVGRTDMSKEEVAENILSICSLLSKMYPGGWENIRSLRIKSPISSALPIYITLKNKNSVTVPTVQPRRPKAYRDVTGVLSTMNRSGNVTVTADGDVIVRLKRRPQGPKRKIKVADRTAAATSD